MVRKISLFEALIPIALLIVLLSLNVALFDDTLTGPNQIALMLAASVAAIISLRLGFSWDSINKRIIHTIEAAMPSILILLLIGALAGTWLISGIVPVMIYYGLDVINPKVFLVTAVIISSIVSLVTGSSWSTVATIGIALLGIGKALGFSEPIIAGAIISGAYFGDKMSPVSDTTNLAPAMAGTDLFTHIRYMMITTVPTIIITLLIFLVIGLNYDCKLTDINVSSVKEAIGSTFNLSPLLFIVPLILFVIIMMRVQPLPALLIGTLLGGVAAIIFQPDIIKTVATNSTSYAESSYKSVVQAMFGDISLKTEVESVNELLTTGGMKGMLNTVWLIISAMVFGGVMEAGGLLQRITRPIVERAKTTGSLVVSTVISCIFFNTTASDQYIAIVIPGRMFRETYRQKGYKPELLSRTLEDAGTVTSVLIPWNTCGATQARVLGVSTLSYLPYCFFNIISPLMSIAIAYLNIKIRRLTPEEMEVRMEN